MAIYLSHDSDKRVMMLAQALELSDEGKLTFKISSLIYYHYIY